MFYRTGTLLFALALTCGCSKSSLLSQARDADRNSGVEPNLVPNANFVSDTNSIQDSSQDAVDAQAEPMAGWRITTYYTVIESYFSGRPQQVKGCLKIDCSAAGDPNNVLATLPSDFVATVITEGNGKMTSGANAGRYLNWSGSMPGSGFWLDSAARNAQGTALVAFESAAAHPSVSFGTKFKVLQCGVDSENAEQMNDAACAKLKAGNWVVVDRFEANTKKNHIDLYIGEQDRADMENSVLTVDQVNVVTTLK